MANIYTRRRFQAVLVLLGCCVMFCLPAFVTVSTLNDGWLKHTFVSVPFQINLPIGCSVTSDSVVESNKTTYKLRGRQHNHLFDCSISKLKTNVELTNEQFQELVVDRFAQDFFSGGKVLDSQKKISGRHFFGREFTYHNDEDRVQGKARLLCSGSHMIIVHIVAEDDPLDQDQANQFFQSLIRL